MRAPEQKASPKLGPKLVLVTGLPGTGKSTIAETVSSEVNGAVLAHDWAMSALRPFPEVQAALARIEPFGHRSVGWSILGSLAIAELRRGRSIVLDGVARAPEIAQCREAAAAESAALVLVANDCSDVAVHRSRVEGRSRSIPGWYELEWSAVERSRETWERPAGADLYLDAGDSLDDNLERVRALFHR